MIDKTPLPYPMAFSNWCLICTIALEDQSYLWGALTTNYRPSVVYKIRLVSIFDDVQLGGGQVITQTQNIVS